MKKSKDCQLLSGSEVCANTLQVFVGDLSASQIHFSCCFLNALMYDEMHVSVLQFKVGD